MAVAVISGLASSTLLTLVVIPGIYALVDDLQQRLLGRREPAAAAARPPLTGGAADAVPS
jgi:hypothetical protein